METWNMDHAEEWKQGTWIMQMNRNMEHGSCRGMETWNMDHADE